MLQNWQLVLDRLDKKAQSLGFNLFWGRWQALAKKSWRELLWGAAAILCGKRGRLLFRPPQCKPRGRWGKRASWLSLLQEWAVQVHPGHVLQLDLQPPLPQIGFTFGWVGGLQFGPLPCSLFLRVGMSCENPSWQLVNLIFSFPVYRLVSSLVQSWVGRRQFGPLRSPLFLLLLSPARWQDRQIGSKCYWDQISKTSLSLVPLSACLLAFLQQLTIFSQWKIIFIFPQIFQPVFKHKGEGGWRAASK